MNQYLSSASLKALAKGQLLGKYGTVIGAYLLHFLCAVPFGLAVTLFISTDTIWGTLIYCIALFLFGLLSGYFIAGETYIYLKIACNQTPYVSDLFHFFRGDTLKLFQVQAVLTAIDIICTLPSLLLSSHINQSLLSFDADMAAAGVLPVNASLFLVYIILYLAGTIINFYVHSLLFSQVFYLMLDFPEYTAPELLKRSARLMKGSKGRLLYISLSFVPLIILGAFSFGIAFLWLIPYMEAVNANFYLDLIRKSKNVKMNSEEL
ncbi:DUF975 family protein [Parablautia intestinalis]|nr:DUF975 family protein [Parablautia intestinalis]